MMRCSREKQQNTWDGTGLQPRGLEGGCQTQDGCVLSHLSNVLCGVSECLGNRVSLGVQRSPAQVERSDSERLTLGEVQEEGKRAVNIGAEGQGSSGPAAKLRLRRPLPAGEGHGGWKPL